MIQAIQWTKKTLSRTQTAWASLMIACLSAGMHTQAQAQSSGQNFSKVAENMTTTMTTMTNLATRFCGLVGLIMVGNSLFNLYKASKDPSHQVKPASGVIGLVIGGLLLAVGTVAEISTNTFVN